MTKSESQSLTRSRARTVAKAGTERIAMLGGGYGAGRYMRESKIQGQPAPLVLGIVGLLAWRRAGRGATRMVMAAAVGAGCYGAGKLGEKHGIAAGNDGNLFSWGTKTGVVLD